MLIYNLKLLLYYLLKRKILNLPRTKLFYDSYTYNSTHQYNRNKQHVKTLFGF